MDFGFIIHHQFKMDKAVSIYIAIEMKNSYYVVSDNCMYNFEILLYSKIIEIATIYDPFMILLSLISIG